MGYPEPLVRGASFCYTPPRQRLQAVIYSMMLDPEGDVEHAAAIKVDSPRLWSPRAPALYLLNTRLVSEDKDIDERATQIGIRHIEIGKDGFSINGEKMFLRGVNRHQEYPYVGYAVLISSRNFLPMRITGTPSSSRKPVSTMCDSHTTRIRVISCARQTNSAWLC